MGVLLNAAVFSAFERIPIALALMLFYTYPAGVVVADAVLGRETITPTRVLALLLSTTGVALVLAGGMTGGSERPIDPVGVLLGLAAAACQVVFVTISRTGYRTVRADAATLVILGGSMVGGAILAVVAGQGAGLLAPFRTLSPWPIILLAGVVAAGLASLLFLTAIRRIGGTRTGILMLFEPVVGTILAGLLLGEIAGADRADGRRARPGRRLRPPGPLIARSRAARRGRRGTRRLGSVARVGLPALGAMLPVRLPLVARDRVLDVAFLVTLDPHWPVHDERAHEAHAGLLHDPSRPGVHGHRAMRARGARRTRERPVDERATGLGGVPAAPRGPDQPIAELRLVTGILGQGTQVEPADERPGLALDRRPEPVSIARLVVREPVGQAVLGQVVDAASGRRRSGSASPPGRCRARQVVEVVGRETAQDEPRRSRGRRGCSLLLVDLERAVAGLDRDPPVHDLDRVDGERELGRRVERLAVGQVEARQVERAGQGAGGQEAAVELEVLVRAGALHGVEVAVDVDDEHGVGGVDPDHLHLALGELVDAEQVDRGGSRGASVGRQAADRRLRRPGRRPTWPPAPRAAGPARPRAGPATTTGSRKPSTMNLRASSGGMPRLSR